MVSQYTQGMVENARAPAGSPPGLYRLCLAEMWERAAYYGMRGLLVLFLTFKTQGGLGWSTGDALELVASWASSWVGIGASAPRVHSCSWAW
jgi:POT family proton-dependent oligopeptide transporter